MIVGLVLVMMSMTMIIRQMLMMKLKLAMLIVMTGRRRPRSSCKQSMMIMTLSVKTMMVKNRDYHNRRDDSARHGGPGDQQDGGSYEDD